MTHRIRPFSYVKEVIISSFNCPRKPMDLAFYSRVYENCNTGHVLYLQQPNSGTGMMNWPLVTSPWRKEKCRIWWEWVEAGFVTGKLSVLVLLHIPLSQQENKGNIRVFNQDCILNIACTLREPQSRAGLSEKLCSRCGSQRVTFFYCS